MYSARPVLLINSVEISFMATGRPVVRLEDLSHATDANQILPTT